MSHVLTEEEYEEIEQDLKDCFEDVDDSREIGSKFTNFYRNSIELYKVLESSAEWDEEGELYMGFTEQSTANMKNKAGLDQTSLWLNKALALLEELDLISSKGEKWDLSTANLDEIGKYSKVMAEEGNKIREEHLSQGRDLD